jgi:hypothetical protein
MLDSDTSFKAENKVKKSTIIKSSDIIYVQTLSFNRKYYFKIFFLLA